jgi:hypothetical protein
MHFQIKQAVKESFQIEKMKYKKRKGKNKKLRGLKRIDFQETQAKVFDWVYNESANSKRSKNISTGVLANFL